MINVLIVEDSAPLCEVITRALQQVADIRVVGAVASGRDAVEFVRRHKPDVIAMDVASPSLGGVEATQAIMSTTPVPIIALGVRQKDGAMGDTFRALDVGAIAVAERPSDPASEDHAVVMRKLVQLVKLMSEIHVVRRVPGARPPTAEADMPRPTASFSVLAIGASTGGPVVMERILSRLSPSFPLPIVLVQHIAQGFVQGFVDWLNQTSRIPVHLALDGERLIGGRCYVAPDNHQLGIERSLTVSLTKDAPVYGLRPSVSWLFESVRTAVGSRAVAILLTGMGRDGARELLALRQAGAITIAQDRDSSVVHGMPGEAIRLGGATHEMTPDAMVIYLNAIRQERVGKFGKMS